MAVMDQPLVISKIFQSLTDKNSPHWRSWDELRYNANYGNLGEHQDIRYEDDAFADAIITCAYLTTVWGK